MSKIGEEYQLDSNQVEKLIKETDNRIYNSIAAIVQARWAYSIEEYNKKVKNLFTFINIKKKLKNNQTNYKLTMDDRGSDEEDLYIASQSCASTPANKKQRTDDEETFLE